MRLSKTHLILKVGIAACAMGVVVLAFAGCDKPQPSREVFSPRVVGPPWPDQETMPLPAAGTPVPAPILAIQWRSVDAYCMARAGNWPPLHLVMGNIRAAASDLPLQRDTVAVREPEMRNTIHKLDDAIAVHDRLGAMLYANQIYRLAVEMEVPYRPVTPVELAMLSYYTREIEVWCGMRDLAPEEDRDGDAGDVERFPHGAAIAQRSAADGTFRREHEPPPACGNRPGLLRPVPPDVPGAARDPQGRRPRPARRTGVRRRLKGS